MITLNVNGTNHTVNVAPDTPLLWVLRDVLKLTGTKYGCGIEVCGACTVLWTAKRKRPARCRCRRPQAGRSLPSRDFPPSTALLQKAWIAEQVPQCGYCQSGMLDGRRVSAAGEFETLPIQK